MRDRGANPYEPERRGWRGLAHRVFGDGENPLTWGFPLYRLGGILVRIHVFFVVYIVIRMIASFARPGDVLGPGFEAAMLASIFVLVLLHEYGHCLACRWVGGEADEILLWPLGGLAMCRPPQEWKASLITTLGGPAVNAVLFPVFGAAVFVVTGSVSAVLPNPVNLGAYFAASLVTEQGTQPFWLLLLGALHLANLILLVFNLLVPMYPMDSGRVVMALIWRSAGYERAMALSARIGLVAAGVLGVAGIAVGETILLAIAIFGGVSCWIEIKREKFLVEDEPYAASLSMDEDDGPTGPSRREMKAAAKEAELQVEVDRILAKISASGKDSLTRAEKRTLDRASRAARGG